MGLEPLTVEQIPAEPPPVLVVIKFHTHVPQATITRAREIFRASFAEAGKPCPPFVVVGPDIDVQVLAMPDLIEQLEKAGFVRADTPVIAGPGG